MKKSVILLLFLIAANVIVAQDTIETFDTTSVKFEDQRNYFGVNITPLLAGVVSGKDNFNVKVNLSYKRNFGDKNIRFSFNYLTEGNMLLYKNYIPLETTDSSILNRYYNNTYNHYDIRIGFEELRGYYGTRVHVGVDVILGYGTNSSNYYDKLLVLDSSLYLINHDLSPSYGGQHNVDYFIAGLDVSFGFDWVLNDKFMFTLQVTPQFNYYIFFKEQKIDKYNEYVSANDYADFRLGYVDLMLFYRF